MAFTPTTASINPGDLVPASLWNQLQDDIKNHVEALDVSAEFDAPIELSRSRQHLDGAGNIIHNFLRMFGDGSQTVSVKIVTSELLGDDSIGIQAAIDSLPLEGGIVFFPPGNYSIETSINMGGATRHNVMLLGSGPSTKILADDALDGDMIDTGIGHPTTGGFGLVVANMWLDGNSANQGAGPYTGINFRNVTDGMITNVVVEDVKGYGIKVGQAVADQGGIDGVIIKGCHIRDCTQDGIFYSLASSTPTSKKLTIDSCTIHDCTQSGIVLEDSQGVTNLLNNIIYDNSNWGIEAGLAPSTTTLGDLRAAIRGNIVSNNTAGGISISATGVTSRMEKVAIIGNTTTDNSGIGIYIDVGKVRSMAIMGNISSGNSNGIYVSPSHTIGRAQGVVCSGNIIFKNTDDGIRFVSASASLTASTMFGNVAYDTGDANAVQNNGLRITSTCDYISLFGNVAVGNSSSQILNSPVSTTSDISHNIEVD